jgi:hypothetical protein
MDFTNSQAELITALQSIRSVEATAPRQEWGQSNASWVSFLTGFTSEKVYRKNVNDFLLFHENEQPSSNDLGMSLIIYFQKLYDSVNYKATSLRSFYSVFKKFWLHSGRGDLKAMLPIIESNIDKWTKVAEPAKKAGTFTKKDLAAYYDLPDTPERLIRKWYSTVGRSIAGRGAEVYDLKWEDVVELTKQETDEIVLDIKFMRVKPAGLREQVRARITGEVEIKIFQAYKACFSQENRKGRLFRKLKYASDGVTIVGTQQVIEIFMRNIFF